jgi:SAM-dependent methyltransferase
MNKPISDNVWKILACSYCNHSLKQTPIGAECTNCGSSYAYTQSGSLDLHPPRTKHYSLDFEIGAPLLPPEGFPFVPLRSNPKPELNFIDKKIPRHLTSEMLSYFPKARSENSLVLDLGCGAGIHKEVCEHAGFEWVGMDYDSQDAGFLGDAHALPFKSKSFEFILCVTVLQYMRYPFVAMREISRVLQPQGKLIGTVAFLEPFNGVGFYNNTHLGIFNLLQYGGFEIEKISPTRNWSGLTALASMGLFPKMPRAIAKSLVFPLELLHKLWWRAGDLATGKDRESMRIRNFAGSFTFIASKE